MAQQPVNSFEIEDFILSLREFICKYPITIRELLKIQSLMKYIRKSLSIEALSKFEDIDLFGYHDSGASGSSGDSGADDLPYRDWTYHKINDDQKQITIEKLSEDIRLYFNMITSFTEKRARARQMVNILFHADRRSFKGFAYLF